MENSSASNRRAYESSRALSLVLVTILGLAGTGSEAQDAATEQRLNKLSGQVEDLQLLEEAARKDVEELDKKIEDARQQLNRPNPGYASQQELQHLAEAVREVDRKRSGDNERIRLELLNLGKILTILPPPPTRTVASGTRSNPDGPAATEKGFEYVIQSGDTLSAIVHACREKNVKVNLDQLVRANPRLRPEKLRVGQKLFIPAAPR